MTVCGPIKRHFENSQNASSMDTTSDSESNQKIREAVFGAELLNACRVGKIKYSLGKIKKIRSFNNLIIKDFYGGTPLSYAKAKKMTSVSKKIQKMLVFFLIDECRRKNKENAKVILEEIGDIDRVFNSKQCGEEEYGLIVDTLELEKELGEDNCGIQ